MITFLARFKVRNDTHPVEYRASRDFKNLFSYYTHPHLEDCILERKGIICDESGQVATSIYICKSCWGFHKKTSLPKLALANHNWSGSYKDFGLKKLSFIEQIVVAKLVVVQRVVKLGSHQGKWAQQALKGSHFMFLFLLYVRQLFCFS